MHDAEPLKLPPTLPHNSMKDGAMRGFPLVLVVEDEWLVRDSIAAYLRAAEWDTLEASTGEAALSVLKAGTKVDVIFTDIQLGGAITGWDVASAFRTVLPAIPIIYASGHAHRPDLAVTQSLFIAKPYESDAIVRACRALHILT